MPALMGAPCSRLRTMHCDSLRAGASIKLRSTDSIMDLLPIEGDGCRLFGPSFWLSLDRESSPDVCPPRAHSSAFQRTNALRVGCSHGRACQAKPGAAS